MELDTKTYRLNRPGVVAGMSFTVGFIGLALCIYGLYQHTAAFYHAYLIAFAFWLSVGLGGLFFTLLHNLTNATWSVVLRRMSEAIMTCLPLMFFFFIPLIWSLFSGDHELYHWSDPEHVEHDELLQWKSKWLNPGFFILRAVIYFGIWLGLSRLLVRLSLSQDERNATAAREKMCSVSAPGMILFAFTMTFAVFDWLMSLSPHWYSTILGVYFFAGCTLSVLALMTIVAIALNRQGILDDIITVEHYHDLGKLLFAFTIFWAYIAFSQMMLIWYASIPEETVWFQHRWEGPWKGFTLVLILIHFIIPFIVLLSRETKRHMPTMMFMSIWILAVHWFDMFWIVYPNFSHGVEATAPSGMEILLMVGAFVGIGGIFIGWFWKTFTSHPLIPIKDPRLEASINFTNSY